MEKAAGNDDNGVRGLSRIFRILSPKFEKSPIFKMKSISPNISRHDNGTLYLVARRGGKLIVRSLRTTNLARAKRLVSELGVNSIAQGALGSSSKSASRSPKPLASRRESRRQSRRQCGRLRSRRSRRRIPRIPRGRSYLRRSFAGRTRILLVGLSSN